MNSTFFRLLVWLLACSPLMASAKNSWYEHQFDVMGTRARVEFQWDNEAEANKLIQSVETEMRRIDSQMSPWIATSELARLNRDGAKGVVLSPELFALIQRSLEFSELTQGAFDITFSSVGYLYDYRQKQRPEDQQIKQLLDAVDYKKLIAEPSKRRVTFSDPRVRVDLGGIAKGHAVDNCIAILQKAGVRNGLVNAGGDTRIIGKKDNRDWYIGIRHPRDKDKLIANLPLENISISTSGDYERFFEENGVRYHHIINPATGKSAKGVQSVTILAPDSTTADALSTSVFVLGVERGMALVNRLPDISAIVIDGHGRMFLSKDLMPAN